MNEQQQPPVLLAEALGYSAQLLLDDIINIANNAVQDGVNGMEGFLQQWADGRVDRLGGEWDSTQEVEQGLVAFQTLLEYHTDLAFDFFEAWSLRNIFVIPHDLPVVLPHHHGLDLTQVRDQQLMEQIQDLRTRIENQEKTRRLLNRALRVSTARRRRAQSRLERLQFVDGAALDQMVEIPDKLEKMFETVSSLSQLDQDTVEALSQFEMSQPGKRQWETSKTGYLKWAVGQLLGRVRRQGEASAVVADIERKVGSIGDVDVDI